MNNPRVREAFLIMKEMASRMKPGHPLWYQAVSAVMFLGWVLEEPVFTDNCETYLKEARSHVRNPVTLEVDREIRPNQS